MVKLREKQSGVNVSIVGERKRRATVFGVFVRL